MIKNLKSIIFNRKSLTLVLAPILLFSVYNIYQNNRVNEIYAVDPLVVTYTGGPPPSPMFTVSNMLPGDEVEKDFNVKNDSPDPVTVEMLGNKTDEEKAFAEILDVEVIELPATPIFQGTLQDFFDSPPINLGGFPVGVDKNFRVKVKFPSSAGNEYQLALVVFDIIWRTELPPIELPEECRLLAGTITAVIEGTEQDDFIQGTDASELILAKGGRDRVDAGAGDDCIIGGDGNDRKLDGSHGNDIIVGGEGDDEIDGSDGEDIIYGNGGNDKIDGSDNDDLIYGGSGHDDIDGGGDNDVIYAEDGNDKVKAGQGDDFVSGGIGNDEIDGESGNDAIFGDEGNDKLEGGSGNDNIFGGTGNDDIEGGSGTDGLFGEQGDDVIEGNSGNDFLDGGPNFDDLDGNAGTDTCTNGEITDSCEL